MVKKNIKTSLKTGFAQIFSCCPKQKGGSKIRGGGAGPYATLNETKKDKLFFKQLRTSYLSE